MALLRPERSGRASRPIPGERHTDWKAASRRRSDDDESKDPRRRWESARHLGRRRAFDRAKFYHILWGAIHFVFNRLIFAPIPHSSPDLNDLTIRL